MAPRDYLNKEHILARQIERCKVKLGDKVRSTTGQKAGKTGFVHELISDPARCEWKKGGKQPYFVVVRYPLMDPQIPNRSYGHELVKFPVKQLRFAR